MIIQSGGAAKPPGDAIAALLAMLATAALLMVLARLVAWCVEFAR